tara:strand:- start:165 stop:1169 length:1005 start_codon:yes stop_codon:yes gene_type:complete
MKYFIEFITLSLLTIFSCYSQEKPFSVTGKTSNIKDGTWFYLKELNRDILIDSVKVENNAFKLESKIDSFPVRVLLQTKDYKNYAFFWLEDRKLVFDASNSNFKEALVTGNINKLNYHLRQSLKSTTRFESLKLEKQFIEDNPNSIISATILSTYKTTFSRNDVERLYFTFSKENKNSFYGESIAKFLSLHKGELKLGDKFVDFEMLDDNNENRKLSDVKANYILLEFWASNCGPCRQENPNLVKTYNKFKNKGFEIFAVSEDINKENWLKAIKKDNLPWTHVSDLSKDNSASLIYGISGIPDNFLIDKNGVIIARNLRGEDLNMKLEELLYKK